MTTVITLFLGLWVFYMGWKFYRQVDWNEPPESTPDVKALHKREAELLHVQEVLETAHAEQKLSDSFLAEFNKYCETELAALQDAAKKR